MTTATTDKAADLLSRPKHLGQSGDANALAFHLTPSQGYIGDTLRFGIIPAGSEVLSIVLANEDLDSAGPSITYELGYSPVNSNDGSLAADLDYFVATGATGLGAANAGKIINNFDPIKFEQDVFLDMTLSASAATYASGKIWIIVNTRNVGVK